MNSSVVRLLKLCFFMNRANRNNLWLNSHGQGSPREREGPQKDMALACNANVSCCNLQQKRHSNYKLQYDYGPQNIKQNLISMWPCPCAWWMLSFSQRSPNGRFLWPIRFVSSWTLNPAAVIFLPLKNDDLCIF